MRRGQSVIARWARGLLILALLVFAAVPDAVRAGSEAAVASHDAGGLLASQDAHPHADGSQFLDHCDRGIDCSIAVVFLPHPPLAPFTGQPGDRFRTLDAELAGTRESHDTPPPRIRS